MADEQVIKAAEHFQCPSCNEVRKTDRPREVKPMRPLEQNVFEIKDSTEARHSVLSIIDMAARYQVVVRV